MANRLHFFKCSAAILSIPKQILLDLHTGFFLLCAAISEQEE